MIDVDVIKIPSENRWKLNTGIYDNYKPYGMDKIKISVKNKYGKILTFDNIPVNFIQRGPVGSVSNSGALNYPAGTWNSYTTYQRGEYTTPYVYYNDNYYLLKSDISVNQNPTNSTDWTLIDKMPSIYTELLLANNASFGSKYGAIFYNNFMYSQQGINAKNQSMHYSAYVDDIFTANSSNNNISEFTGEFIPNTSIDFYSGSISCNRMSEKYDYFYPFSLKRTTTSLSDISNDNSYWYNVIFNEKNIFPQDNLNAYDIVFHNTYYMDFSKSQNLCILPRLIKTFVPNSGIKLNDNDALNIYNEFGQTYNESDIYDNNKVYGKDIYKGFDSEYCVNRPGVVVLPNIDSEYIKNGARVHITYPMGQIDKNAKLLHGFETEFSRKFDSTDHIYGKNENYEFSWAHGATYNNNINGDTLPYIAKNNLINSTEGYIIVCADYNIMKNGTSNNDGGYFLWNDKKCKFIMLSPGCEIKLRTVVEENYFLNLDPNNVSTSDINIKNNTTIKGSIKKSKKTVYWVIENTADLLPIDLNVHLYDRIIESRNWSKAFGENEDSGLSRAVNDIINGPCGAYVSEDRYNIDIIEKCTVYEYNIPYKIDKIEVDKKGYGSLIENDDYIALGSGVNYSYENVDVTPSWIEKSSSERYFAINMNKSSVFSPPSDYNYKEYLNTTANRKYNGEDYGKLRFEKIERYCANTKYDGIKKIYNFGKMCVNINKHNTADNSIVRVGEYDVYTKLFAPLSNLKNIFNFNKEFLKSVGELGWYYMLINSLYALGYNYDSMLGIPYTSTIIYFNGKTFNWYSNSSGLGDNYGDYSHGGKDISDVFYFATDKEKLDLQHGSITSGAGSDYDLFDNFNLKRNGSEAQAQETIKDIIKNIHTVFGASTGHNQSLGWAFSNSDEDMSPHDFINCGYNYLKFIC